jgi:hypothetical protein
MLERFPIDELLARLHDAGFEVSVADRLRALRLLDVIGVFPTRDELFARLRTAGRELERPDHLTTFQLLEMAAGTGDTGTVTGDEVRLGLRTLFASSEEGQQRFDAVFRSLDTIDPAAESGSSRTTIPAVRIHDGTGKTRKRLARRRWIAIAAACTLAALLAIAMWLRERPLYPIQSVLPPTNTTATTPTTQPLPIATPTSSHGFVGAQAKGEAKNLEEQPVNWVLLALFIGLFLGGGLATDLVRLLRRHRDPGGMAGQKPPFEYQRSPESDAAIFESQSIQQAATALRGRVAGERLEVDVRRTIRATVDGGGFPRLHYLGSAQSPEYLALIDRRSPDDHLATYFDLLVEQLSDCGAAIDRYTFERDPRICTASDGTTVETGQLRAARPTAKVLLFTDAEGLLDARTGEWQDWVEHDLAWDQRALLVPAIPHPARLTRLSEYFVVEPADAAGLLHLAQRFASSTVTIATPVIDAPVAEEPSLAQLRRVLSADVFRWLTACAVQRSLEWNATLSIGRVAHPAATEKELLELVRLGWFRRGSIPEIPRGELLAILAEDAVLRRDAEKAVAQELHLRSAQAESGSFAAEILLVEAVAHDLSASDGIDPKLARKLRRVNPELIRRDEDLPRLLAPARETLPGLGSRLRFRGGIKPLGPSAWAYTVLMVTFAALLAVGGGVKQLIQQTKAPETIAKTDTADTELPEPDPDMAMPLPADRRGTASSSTSTTSTSSTTGSLATTGTTATSIDTSSTTATTSTAMTNGTSSTDTSLTSRVTSLPSVPSPPPPSTAPEVPAGCSAAALSTTNWNTLDLVLSKTCEQFLPNVGEAVEVSGSFGFSVSAKVTQVKALTVSVAADASEMSNLADVLDVTSPGGGRGRASLINMVAASGTLLVRGVRIPISVVRPGPASQSPADLSSPGASNSMDLEVPVDKTSAFLSIANPQGVSPSDISIEFLGSSTQAETSRQWKGPTEKLTRGLWSVHLRNDFYDETLRVKLEAGKTTGVRFHDPKYGIVVFAKTAGMRAQVLTNASANPSSFPKATVNTPANGDLFLRAEAGHYNVGFSGISIAIKVTVTAGVRTTMVIPSLVPTARPPSSAQIPTGSTANVPRSVPRTSFQWDETENISDTFRHNEWTRQPDGRWQQMQEYRGNVTAAQEIAHRTYGWREIGRATVDGTTGVIVRAEKSAEEVFLPDLNGGKNPSVVLTRANAKESWSVLDDLSVDHRM